ncbi:MAG: penicillin-binding protein 2, partial [Candidatus Omnitrophica bacterium]|nr:penicillin-binding protein 2 [Candidatus Omnitrophota bacterium]
MRIRVITAVYFLFFAVLFTGLVQLQFVRGSYFSSLAEKNRIRLVPIPAARGPIRDRNGEVLADTRASYDVYSIPEEVTPESRSRLLPILGPSAAEEMERAGRESPLLPVRLARDVTKEQVIRLEEQRLDLKGVWVESVPIRFYPQGAVGVHVVGYVGLVAEHREALETFYGVHTDLPEGVMGVEEGLNDRLTGVMGGEELEVDNRGRRQRLLGIRVPQQGDEVQLTLDLELERLAQALLAGFRGAIVVMDPRDGAVLALASSPAYDPNVFVEPSRGALRAGLLNNPERPLFNRATMGEYPPGSTFKMITAAAALAAQMDPSRTYHCSGSFRLGNTQFGCWKEGGHGDVDLLEALTVSCNNYFYNLGLALGPDRLSQGALAFGLSQPTGILLGKEAKGLVPSKRWKKSALNQPWYDGETAHFAIGQGYIAVTPIQVARFVSCFANGGYLVSPYVVKGSSEKPRPISLDPAAIRTVRKGLFRVVNDPSGTGKNAHVEGLAISGKTGTA